MSDSNSSSSSPPAPSSSSSSSSPPAPSASPPPSASSPPPSSSSSPPPSSPPPSSPPPSASPPPSDKKSPPSFAVSPLTASAVETHPPPPQSSPAGGGSGSPPPPATDNASPPPPSNSKPNSPPPPSNSKPTSPPPPSNSKPSSPPPPPPTNSGQPPPPSSTSNSWAPPPPVVHQPPPPSTTSPPPPSSSSPPSPPASSSPPPTPPPAVSDKFPPPPSSGPASATTTFSPPPPTSSSLPQPLPAPDISSGTTPPASTPPPNAIPSPQNPGSTNGDTPPSPGITPSASLTKAPPNSPMEKLIPPSVHLGPSNSNPNPSPKSNSSSRTGTIIGSTLAGVVVIAMIVFVFFITRNKKKKKKKGAPAYNGQYGPAPTNCVVEPDGYQYNQQRIPQHILVGSAKNNGFYNGRHPLSPSVVENSAGNDPGGIGGSKSCFSYDVMMEVTNGFSQQNILGEGGFGCVYKGWLPDGRVVAVKQLKAGSGQGEREFRAEVDIISRVHHRHLVSLVGYCIDNHHRLLVYEYLPNNNLEHHLHGKGMPVLEWSKRIKIAIGSARGLAYLHEDCHPKIIHRDIKSANILLDNAFDAQVADFGLAKLTDDTNTHVSTRVMGTFGYLAPEYASSGKLTDRSDVYSFGVVLLELVTGRKPVDPTQPLGDESLVEWARPVLMNSLETGDFTALIDPRLERRYVESEMIRMIEAAAACVRHSGPKRPRMAQVVRALDTEGDLTDLTNGVKLGQSTAYDSGQYSAEVKDFRRMAFGYLDTSDYGMSSGEAASVTVPHSSIELLGSDSESHATSPVGNVTAQSRHDGGKQV